MPEISALIRVDYEAEMSDLAFLANVDVSKAVRARSPATKARLWNIVEIINRSRAIGSCARIPCDGIGG